MDAIAICITIICGAEVAFLTILRSERASESRVATVIGASVKIIADNRRVQARRNHRDAIRSYTFINGAGIIIITINLRIIASGSRVAEVIGAEMEVIADNCCVLATGSRVAAVIRAFIPVIGADYRRIRAFAGSGVTFISSAVITVTAGNGGRDTVAFKTIIRCAQVAIGCAGSRV